MIKKRLTPLLKYPGGKGSELPYVFEYAPKKIKKYVEPFVGGGAVYFAIMAGEYYINDISVELMYLYEYIRDQNIDFFDELKTIVNNWEQLGHIVAHSIEFFAETLSQYKSGNVDEEELIASITLHIEPINILEMPLFRLDNNQPPKFKYQLIKNMISMIRRIVRNEIKRNETLDLERIKENLECCIKSAYYMYCRELYNKPNEYDLSTQRKVAVYLFIREYCYSSMFRFNRNGEFNVPYGGISYNKKSLSSKISYYKSDILLEKLSETNISCRDFYQYIKGLQLDTNDFMFLDPPYDTTFSEYDQNKFDRNDQVRLSKYLIGECNCKFMLIIKKTDFIMSLYQNSDFNIVEVDKNYFVSFKNRNSKDVQHLIIMNY